MAFQFQRLGLNHPDLTGNGQRLLERLSVHKHVVSPRLKRLWDYYQNAATPYRTDQLSSRPYRQAQEYGLPARITANTSNIEVIRKEVVIENDIGWRIDSMVDFLFGQPIVINSSIPDSPRRATIERLLRQILTHNGGIGFFQKIALLGAVYGYVDVLVKYVPPIADASAAVDAAGAIDAAGEPEIDFDRLASAIRLEIVEPTRALPIVSRIDPASAVAYVQHYDLPTRRTTTETTWMDALKQAILRTQASDDRSATPAMEILTPTYWQRYEDEQLVDEGENSLGRLPLVHIQNTALPFVYEGASDVEPLVPLQDELNTRLSDRAYRITMQSFKMYLGKGIDDFTKLPIGPGRMYTTDNENAQIIEFGGDSECPNEQAHIDEIREAIDKTSGVSPIAAGAIKGRIGRLSSAAAMRVTLLALLGRTERKRTTYGPAIAQMCELSLAWLDRAGLFKTTPGERRVEIHWPNPIPANEQEQIDTARAKKELGIDPKEVARELGYDTPANPRSDSKSSSTPLASESALVG